MAFPQVTRVAPGSPGERAGIAVGDELRRVNGAVPSDVIEYSLLTDEAEVELDVERGGLELHIEVSKSAGEPLGLEVSSAVFDRVRTCDNHCAFCFIYQLPAGMRKSLYVKDDDYRLSFLYGNFTTLTRFTELDLERVVSDRLSPLYVSIHATDPELRARLLRNRRGATSLRWLRQLLAHGIEVHGQLVICPGVNDGPALEETLAGILESYPELASAAAVPLGVSRHSHEAEMRPHTAAEAQAVLDTIEHWQGRFAAALGRRLIFAADEYYLLAGRPMPGRAAYEDFPQVENGVGMSRSFATAFAAGRRASGRGRGHRGGFFASVDGAPPLGYRAPRAGPPSPGGNAAPASEVGGPPSTGLPVTVLTARYGAAVLRPLLERAGYSEVEVLAIDNELFGGNIAVTGLLGGADVARVLSGRVGGPPRRYLLPDVCLSEGRFLDGITVPELPLPVEVVETEGGALRAALETRTEGARGLPIAPQPAAVRDRPLGATARGPAR
jgi:putative radical SAM enzyme (TIGR03279 family)